MPQPHAASDAFRETAKLLVHRAAHWLERLEPRAPLGDMNAQAFRCGVIHHGEYGHTAFGQGEASRGVDAPHLVGPLGQDRAVMALRLDRLRLPVGRQQVVCAHQPQHAAQRRVSMTTSPTRLGLVERKTQPGST